MATTKKVSAPERYVDIPWVARYLSMPESWVRYQIRTARIPYHKFGHFVRFDRLEIEAWATAQRVDPEGGDEEWDE